jgi:lipoic acid synthetase
MGCGCGSSGGGCASKGEGGEKKKSSGGCCSSARPMVSLPDWFRQPVPEALSLKNVRDLVKGNGLATVCQSAHCPNIGTCWSRGVATFMILGEYCSRSCRFCAVSTGSMEEVFVEEPIMVAEAVRRLALRYVVITSVNRDDLPDQGSGQFSRTVEAIRSMNPECGIELLVPDFGGEVDLISNVIKARPQVFAHNIETVRRISPLVRSHSDHDRSLGVLATARALDGTMYIKSSVMVGLGETDAEVLEALQELKKAGCDIVTIGQYLAPTRTKRHVPVERFVTPETFEMYRREGMAMGFGFVKSGPLVRSSFLAEEGFAACAAKSVEVGS